MVTKSKRPSLKQTGNSATTPAITTASQAVDGNAAAGEGGPTDLRNLYSAIFSYAGAERNARPPSNGHKATFGEPSPKHQAAVVVSATLELRPADTVAASRQNFSAQIAMGAAYKLPSGLNGSHAGIGTGGRDGQATLMLAPESLQLLNLAAGMALAHKLEKKNNVVLAFVDEDVPSLAHNHEALKVAGKQKLPIVFVLQNEWPDGSAGKDSAMKDINFLAKEYGFPGIIVDGDDAAAIWRVAQESIHRARLGSGPTLLECKTGSSGKEDPLERLERAMRKRGSWNDDWRKQLEIQTHHDVENTTA